MPKIGRKYTGLGAIPTSSNRGNFLLAECHVAVRRLAEPFTNRYVKWTKPSRKQIYSEASVATNPNYHHITTSQKQISHRLRNTPCDKHVKSNAPEDRRQVTTVQRPTELNGTARRKGLILTECSVLIEKINIPLRNDFLSSWENYSAVQLSNAFQDGFLQKTNVQLPVSGKVRNGVSINITAHTQAKHIGSVGKPKDLPTFGCHRQLATKLADTFTKSKEQTQNCKTSENEQPFENSGSHTNAIVRDRTRQVAKTKDSSSHQLRIRAPMNQTAFKILPCTVDMIKLSVSEVNNVTLRKQSDISECKYPIENPYKCSVCSASFHVRNELWAHVRIHPHLRPYRCTQCDYSCKSNAELISHSLIHGTARPYKCEQCDRAYVRKYTLKQHVNRVHDKRKLHVCKKCQTAFYYSSDLERHTHTHVHERDRPHKCPLCHKGFQSMSTLREHHRVHTDERPYKCDKCEASFKWQSCFKEHRRIHTGIRPYKCNECGASFISNKALQVHGRTHTGEKPFKCQECVACFGQRANLAVHIKDVHYRIRPHKCGKCGAAFPSRYTLKKHINVIHYGLRPYKCVQCGAAFSYNEALKKHTNLIHYGLRPYKCVKCGAAFLSGNDLKRHVNTIHYGLRPYKCVQCGVAFSNSSYLNQHINDIHYGLRPYKCVQCGATFKRRSHLKKHVRTHGKTVQVF